MTIFTPGRRKKNKAKPVIFLLILTLLAGSLAGCSTTASVGQGAASGKASTNKSDTLEYGEKIFGKEIISIEILAEENAWKTMLENATKEEYIKVDVVVNGTTVKNVGIRPKGNSSLRDVAASDSERFSFRIKFDQYVEGQTCYGLDTMVLNNMIGDNSYMKEYISYDLMRTIGVDAPYFGFSDIKVNGKAWGLYLAVEAYNDSYQLRTYGDSDGMLYNVKMSGGKLPDGGNNTQPRPDFGGMGPAGGPGGGPGMGAKNGGSLQYTDDKTSSYSDIFDNAVGKSEESDEKRVIAALKALSEGKDLEKYFDVDAILRYLAAHTVVVNLDSYSSSMAQNYYIYEKDGRVTILPWDYNLAWGGFERSDASSVVNFPIDTPVSGIAMSERPLLEKLFANSAYLEKYHGYLQELMDQYFAGGKFEARVDQLDKLISEYVKNDATSFCTYEEYQKAVAAFKQLGNLRAESVKGQLAGTVPSTTAKQKEDPDKLVDPGDLVITDLGSMMGKRRN